MEVKINHPIKIVFKVCCATEFGESLHMVGNIPELSSWNTSASIKLHTKDYTHAAPLWESDTLLLPSGVAVEYKFFKKSTQGTIIWERLPDEKNHSLTLTFEEPAEVYHIFGNTQMQIELKEPSIEDPSPRSRKFTNVLQCITIERPNRHAA